MAYIEIKTFVDAPVATVFNCSRDIDLHQHSMAKSDEIAIAGVTTGLIKLNETVTWQARHFGIRFQLKSKITDFNFPVAFTDEMVHGPFKMLKHIHKFEQVEGGTLMTDCFTYQAPAGFIGTIVEKFVLTGYLGLLLKERNKVIKKVAEDLTNNQPTT